MPPLPQGCVPEDHLIEITEKILRESVSQAAELNDEIVFGKLKILRKLGKRFGSQSLQELISFSVTRIIAWRHYL